MSTLFLHFPSLRTFYLIFRIPKTTSLSTLTRFGKKPLKTARILTEASARFRVSIFHNVSRDFLVEICERQRMHTLLTESEIAVALSHSVSSSKTVFLAVKKRNASLGPRHPRGIWRLGNDPTPDLIQATLDFPESVGNRKNWNSGKSMNNVDLPLTNAGWKFPLLRRESSEDLTRSANCKL